MKYFFVFQNKSYKEEKVGGFLWAPKANKDGQTFHHWTSMTKVEKGDVIFNSFNGELLSIIVAKDDHKDASKPADLESVDLWEEDGWKVEAEYTDVKTPIKYKDYMDDILALQGDKYAPFNVLGRGTPGYLFQITEELANYFLSILKMDLTYLIPSEKNEDELIREVEETVSNEPDETVREQIVESRIGQDIFKKRLMKLGEKCWLCGLDNLEFLRASHSKPWKDSNNKERLDQYNGFLLCPAHDLLYDKGYISFQDDGSILISPLLDEHSKSLMNVHDKMNVNILEGHKEYLGYHRENIFKICPFDND